MTASIHIKVTAYPAINQMKSFSVVLLAAALALPVFQSPNAELAVQKRDGHDSKSKQNSRNHKNGRRGNAEVAAATTIAAEEPCPEDKLPEGVPPANVYEETKSEIQEPVDTYKEGAPVDTYKEGAPVDTDKEGAPVDVYTSEVPVEEEKPADSFKVEIRPTADEPAPDCTEAPAPVDTALPETVPYEEPAPTGDLPVFDSEPTPTGTYEDSTYPEETADVLASSATTTFASLGLLALAFVL